jgi:ribonuclease-3
VLNSLDSFDMDYKSSFIEFCHTKFRVMPIFTVIEETGPDHEKAFLIEVSVNGETLGTGRGKTKKQATQMASKEAIESLKKTA